MSYRFLPWSASLLVLALGACPAIGQEQQAETGQTLTLEAEESVARFEQLLKRRPFHGAAFTGLTDLYAPQGRLSALVDRYRARVEAMPDDQSARIVLTRLLLRVGEVSDAAAMLDTIEDIEGDKARSQLLVLKATVFERAGRVDDAGSMLALALEEATSISDQFGLAEALADLHIRSGTTDAAADTLLALASDHSDNYLHRQRIADALATRNLHDAAAAQYTELLALVADDPERRAVTLRKLGAELESLEQPEAAIDRYIEAMGLLAGNHWMQRELHERVVSLYRATQRLDDLAAYCRDQLRERPEQISLRILLSDVLLAMDDRAGAMQTLADAIALFPADITLSERYIQLLERGKDPAAVSAEYERIIGQHPDETELYIAYGQFLAGQDRRDAARNQWRHVLNSEVATPSLAMRLGILFETNDLPEDAALCYRRAIELSPDQPEAYLALSRLWIMQDKRDEAGAVLTEAAAANPDTAAVHAAVAQAWLRLGDSTAALDAITTAATLEPDNLRHRAARADLLVREGRLEDALSVRRAMLDDTTNPVEHARASRVLVSMYASADQLDQLIASETARLDDAPDDPTALLLLSYAADTERRFADARAHLQTLVDAHPTHEIARETLAELHAAVGDVDAAVAAYQRLVEQHPTRARRYYQAMADLRLRYDDRRGALETFERIVAADPDNATVLSDVAEQVVRLGEWDRGLELYAKALRMQPDNHETRLDYGRGLAEAGRLEEAVDQFRQAALQTTDRETARAAIGRLHETADQVGRIDQVLDDLQQSHERNPDDSLIASVLANLLIREFEYTRAMTLLDGIQQRRPRDAEIGLVRGKLLRRLSRFDEASEQYRILLRIPNIDRDYLLGELGKTAFEAGRVDSAAEYWLQISNRMYAGTLLRNNGLYDEAITVLEAGIRLKPDEFALYRHLFSAYEESGQPERALATAQRLLDLQPTNIYNIEQLAETYIERGERGAGAEIAGRLFSAAVAEDKEQKKQMGQSSRSRRSTASMASAMASSQMRSAWGLQHGPTRNNLDRAVQFFLRHGLIAELETTIETQLEAQPDNAMLHQTAALLYQETFSKPERALELLQALETMSFPLEHQTWLGQGTQTDYFRTQQYALIAQKPALRDNRLAQLNTKSINELTRDELIELAVIRQAQAAPEKSIALLEAAVERDADDALVLHGLVNALVQDEQFAAAEPHARRLVALLAERLDAMQASLVDRIRRDYIRTLPLQLQRRMTDELINDLAERWSLGTGLMAHMYSRGGGSLQLPGYFPAKLALATICAETGKMAEAREMLTELSPTNPADMDSWTTLASIAQTHEQDDLAFTFYQSALEAARRVAGDPLLQQIYGSMLSQATWYNDGSAIDTSFSRIVESFAAEDRLLELYDFLRDTSQVAKAQRIAEQYDLKDRLKTLYSERVADARTAYLEARHGDPLNASVPYFVAVAKLTELHERSGDWPAAEAQYVAYLDDFADELPLLQTLSDVAEAQRNYQGAIAWEQQVLAAKDRLSRTARRWSERQLPIVPKMPGILGSGSGQWTWQRRWQQNQNWWGTARGAGGLDRAPTWMRIAQLHLADDNPIAAAEAFEQAVATSGNNRHRTITQVLSLIRQRQLVKDMLPVLRTLAIYAPTNESAQLAFAESLESAERPTVALEVYERMLRRGVSDLGTLSQVRRRLAELDPEAGAAQVTLDDIRAEAEADPANTRKQLRLAKAYYYALDLDRALETLLALRRDAPHLEDVHRLLIEIYTIRDEPEPLIEALTAAIDRASDEQVRRATRQKLFGVQLASGQLDEALETLKATVNPREPWSYQSTGVILHYFGRHEEATEQFELAGRSQAGRAYYDAEAQWLARSYAIRGDHDAAVEAIMTGIDKAAQQQTQYGSMYGGYMSDANSFVEYRTLFLLHPEIADAIHDRLAATRAAEPDNPQHTRMLMQLHRATGQLSKADALMEQMIASGTADQQVTTMLIERAVKQKSFDRAIELANEFIDSQAAPALPPGVPAEYAAQVMLASPRNAMLCRLGDIYWEMDQPDDAFAAWERIIDEDIDATRIAFATICALRGRLDQAAELIDAELAQQEIRSPQLLYGQALLAARAGDRRRVFDNIVEAIKPQDQAQGGYRYYGGGAPNLDLLGDFAQQSGLVDAYVDLLQERIDNSPHEWSNYQKLATALTNAGRSDEARAVYAAAAESPALEQQALQATYQQLAATDGVEAVIPVLTRLIELRESQVGSNTTSSYRSTGLNAAGSLRDDLGHLYWHLGQTEQAVAVWSERLDQRQASSHLKLAGYFADVHAWDRAEAAYERALELDPQNTAAHYGLATLRFHQGDTEAARHHLHEYHTRREERNVASGGNAYDPYAYTYMSQQRGGVTDLHLVASAIGVGTDAADASVMAEHLTIAELTGDWDAQATLLRDRLQDTPYDPVSWSMWADANMRAGDWDEAINAFETLQHLSATTLPEHRKQLELLLAGEQIRDAAAGSQRSGSPIAGGMPQPTRTTRYQSRYYNSQQTVNTLAALYVRRGDYASAEYLLISRAPGRAAQNALPTLSSLMWKQDARDRAVELMKLALLLGSDESALPRYTSMLGDLGRTNEAIDLLQRAYRTSSAATNQYRYGWYYGYGEGFEDAQEKQYADALLHLLEKTDRVDSYLADLRAELDAAPDDPRLSKLILSLQIRTRQWDAIIDSLERWRGDHPEDLGAAAELAHAYMQQSRWSDAMTITRTLREQDTEQRSMWTLTEAVIHLAQDSPEAVEETLRELTDDLTRTPEDVDANDITTLLMATDRREAMLTYLRHRHERHLADTTDTRRYFDALLQAERWPEAFALAGGEFWMTAEPLTGTSLWRQHLARAAAAMRAAGASIDRGAFTAPNQALLTLVIDGPDAACHQFELIRGTHPLASLRGRVLCASEAGRDTEALAATDALLAWLRPRRGEIWYQPPAPPLADRFDESLQQMQRWSSSSASALSGQPLTSLLADLLRTPRRARYYGVLYDTYAEHRRSQLAATGQFDVLEQTLQEQAALNRVTPSSNRQDTGYMFDNYDRYSGYYDEPESIDPAADLRSTLLRHRQSDEVASRYAALGTRIPPTELLDAAEASAHHDLDAARPWQQWAAKARAATILADDAPAFRIEQRWRWSMYGDGRARMIDQIRRALGYGPFPESLYTDPDRPRSRISGPMNEYWELAMDNDQAAARLDSAAERFGPGWENSRTFRSYIRYANASGRAADVVAAMDAVFTTDELVQSGWLGWYVRACFTAERWDALEIVLDAAAAVSPALNADVARTRLMVLRHQDDTEAADTLEQELLARAAQRQRAPRPIATHWLAAEGINQVNRQRTRQRRGTASRPQQDDAQSDLQRFIDLHELAERVDVRLDAAVQDDDQSLTAIRKAYETHLLWPHAARLLQMEIDTATSDLERADLLQSLVRARHRAGDEAAAQQTARRLEQTLLQLIEAAPAAVDLYATLTRLYASPAYGRAYDKAIAAAEAARKVHPASDPHRLTEAHMRFRSGDHTGAWQLYEQAIRRGAIAPDAEAELYRAGLAAYHGGARERGESLLRQALVRDPSQTLATQAREILNG